MLNGRASRWLLASSSVCSLAALGVAAWAIVGAVSGRSSARSEESERAIRLLQAEVAEISRRAADAWGRARAVASGPGARRAVGAEPLALRDRLAHLERRLAELERFSSIEPRLLSLEDISTSDPSLADELFSIAHYRAVILDPESGVEERSRALLTLSRLPNPEAHLVGEVEDAWPRDQGLANDERSQTQLMRVYRGVRAGERVRDALLSTARFSPFETARDQAINSLNQHYDDDLVRQVVSEALEHDPSASVRERARDFLRRREAYGER